MILFILLFFKVNISIQCGDKAIRETFLSTRKALVRPVLQTRKLTDTASVLFLLVVHSKFTRFFTQKDKQKRFKLCIYRYLFIPIDIILNVIYKSFSLCKDTKKDVSRNKNDIRHCIAYSLGD